MLAYMVSVQYQKWFFFLISFISDNLPNLKICGMAENDFVIRKNQIAQLICYFPEPCPKLKDIVNKLDKSSPYWVQIQQEMMDR